MLNDFEVVVHNLKNADQKELVGQLGVFFRNILRFDADEVVVAYQTLMVIHDMRPEARALTRRFKEALELRMNDIVQGIPRTDASYVYRRLNLEERFRNLRKWDKRLHATKLAEAASVAFVFLI